MTVGTKHEEFGSYEILKHRVDRIKTSTSNIKPQDLHVYPQIDKMLHDYYWSFGYHMVLDSGDSDFLFPSYAAKVLGNASNFDAKVDSKVSGLFNAAIKSLCVIVDDYLESEW